MRVLLLLLLFSTGVAGCASRPNTGSAPVPKPVIEKEADTKVPDASDASDDAR